MKLYIASCDYCGQRMNIGINASTRNELRFRFGGDDFYCTCGNCGTRSVYNVLNVIASSEINATPGGALAGGLVGLLGGPIGLIIGGVIGGAIGNISDNEDTRKADVFNQSQ
jgi:hypothetical protein